MAALRWRYGGAKKGVGNGAGAWAQVPLIPTPRSSPARLPPSLAQNYCVIKRGRAKEEEEEQEKEEEEEEDGMRTG